MDGIKYQRLGNDKFYAQELFEEEELTGYLKNMLLETKKSVYEQVQAALSEFRSRTPSAPP